MKNRSTISSLVCAGVLLFTLGCSKINDSSIEMDTSVKLSQLEAISSLKIIQNESDRVRFSLEIDELIFTYEARNENKETISSLKVAGQFGTIETNFRVNVSLEGYKYLVHKHVNEQAQKLKNNLAEHEAVDVAALYELFGRSILSNKVDRASPMMESIFFHNAALTTLARTLREGKEECNCTPDPAYFVNKTSFWCQEDYYIDPTELVKRADQSKRILSESEAIVYDYLKANMNEERISIDHMYDLIIPKEEFMNRVNFYYRKYREPNTATKAMSIAELDKMLMVESGECLNGGEWGCCGNYNGCCWYYNNLCFWHDLICLCCEEWYCLWGCVPEGEYCG